MHIFEGVLQREFETGTRSMQGGAGSSNMPVRSWGHFRRAGSNMIVVMIECTRTRLGGHITSRMLATAG